MNFDGLEAWLHSLAGDAALSAVLLGMALVTVVGLLIGFVGLAIGFVRLHRERAGR